MQYFLSSRHIIVKPLINSRIAYKVPPLGGQGVCVVLTKVSGPMNYVLHDACGALLFSFFARPKNETKKRRRHRIYSPDGVAAMWSRSAWYTQNYFFDIGQRCPVALKII
jgi:hypothetical protein